MLEITKIEKELIKLSKSEKKKWQEIAILLIKVREQNLFISQTENSYSAWLNKLAERANLHPSGFWRFLAAGTYYLEQTGKEVDALESIGISAHKLELVKKIAELEPALEKDLFEKVISDNVTVKELKDQFEILKDGLTSIDKKRSDMQYLVESFKDSLESMNLTEYKRVINHLIDSVHRTGNRQIIDEVLDGLNLPMSHPVTLNNKKTSVNNFVHNTEPQIAAQSI
jgi:hypothetical protein